MKHLRGSWPCRAGIAALLALAGAALLSVGPALAVRSFLTISSSAELAPHSKGGATASCPAPLRPFWGGFFVRGAPAAGNLPTAFKPAGRAWRTLATNSGSEAHGVSTEAYCIRRHRPFSERSRSTRIGAGLAGSATASCPPGRTVVGGGFRASVDPGPGGRHVVITAMRRVGARGIGVTGANLSPSRPGDLTAYAYCSRGPRPLAFTGTAAVPPGGTARLVAKCPRAADGGGTIQFAGFEGSSSVSGALVSPAQFRRGSNHGVILTAVNHSPTDAGEATAFVYCR